MKLKDYNSNGLKICKESTLHLVLRLSGGGSPGVLFVDPTTASIENKKFSDNAPKWRIIDKGLNIEGEC